MSELHSIAHRSVTDWFTVHHAVPTSGIEESIVEHHIGCPNRLRGKSLPDLLQLGLAQLALPSFLPMDADIVVVSCARRHIEARRHVANPVCAFFLIDIGADYAPLELLENIIRAVFQPALVSELEGDIDSLGQVGLHGFNPAHIDIGLVERWR